MEMVWMDRDKFGEIMECHVYDEELPDNDIGDGYKRGANIVIYHMQLAQVRCGGEGMYFDEKQVARLLYTDFPQFMETETEYGRGIVKGFSNCREDINRYIRRVNGYEAVY